MSDDVGNTEMAMAVAEAVRQIRQAEGWTLDELADRSGLHRTTIGLVERGERFLSIASATQLAQAFSMPLSELVAHAERETILKKSGGGSVTTTTTKVVPRATKRLVDPAHVENEDVLRRVLGLGADAILSAIEQTYDTVDLIDDELRAKESPPISRLVELANLSSMLGNLLGAGFANASGGAYVRNRPHAFPDLLPQRDDLPPVELKTALEANKPKGHLAKAGTYMTFRYVLADREGNFESGRQNRGDTPWIWEVRCGRLEEADFSISNTEGDSGKTAVIRTESFLGMTRVFYNPLHLPYARRNSPWGDG